jgi:hypothetical protein
MSELVLVLRLRSATVRALFSLKSNIFPLISHSKQMSKMYIERWHSAERCLKCTLKPEAQRTKFSLLEASLRVSKANFVCSKLP